MIIGFNSFAQLAGASQVPKTSTHCRTRTTVRRMKRSTLWKPKAMACFLLNPKKIREHSQFLPHM